MALLSSRGGILTTAEQRVSTHIPGDVILYVQGPPEDVRTLFDLLLFLLPSRVVRASTDITVWNP